MKIAVVGAPGQLGSDVCAVFKEKGHHVTGLGKEEMNISDEVAVNKILSSIRPQVVINTAAYHNVEKCELNPAISFEVNGIGARNLAIGSNNLDYHLIHISTDYVFDGKEQEPYLDGDRPVPLNVYGNTKLSGEHFIESIARRYLIMRTSGLYGSNPCRAKGGMNFVKLMLKLGRERDEVRVVDHEVLTPTSTLEVARQVLAAAEAGLVGISHATAEGACSWYEFAREIFKLKEIDTTLNIAVPGEFPEKVPRPYYSVLENAFLKANNVNVFKTWQQGLKEYLDKIQD